MEIREESISCVILTHNEILHIERCLTLVYDKVDEIVIVDSFSDDGTYEFIRANFPKVRVYQRKWKNYADQYHYAQGKCLKTWILRLDADEYIENFPIPIKNSANGYFVKRYIIFNDEVVRYGGASTWQLRFYRKDRGAIENSWMDEHILVDGKVLKSQAVIYDNNLNDLNWWHRKHLSYSDREIKDLNDINHKRQGLHAGARFKRSVKHLFLKNWGLTGATILFLIKYFFMLGIFDSKGARSFHFFQGFWYRYLVAVKYKKNL